MKFLIIGYISLIVATISNIIYIVDILRGKTKPHAFSWLVWSILGLSVFLFKRLKGQARGICPKFCANCGKVVRFGMLPA